MRPVPVYVAFLRAVNVRGRYVRMAGLRAALESAGFGEVESYIQSGNVRVRSRRRSTGVVAAELSAALGEWAGFDIPAMVRTPSELTEVAATVAGTPALLQPAGRRYVAFAGGVLSPDAVATLESWSVPGERARSLGQEVLCEFRAGMQGLTLSGTRLERIAGVPTTWRDITVVRALAERWGTG
ncbi:MAG: DUF1697 domain-containing protein [Dermatophilaceae bacterium]